LKQQRALADTWIAADEHERARNDPATEHAIKLSDARRNANVVLRFDLGERDCRDFAKFEAVSPGSLTRRLRLFFDERIPLATFRTLAQPLAGRIPTTLADERCFNRSHKM
jgi:hypothetical protein